MIKKCKILLWDQIGSGTVEALACEVPSMIFWKRIYSKEAKWAKAHISDLEDVGVKKALEELGFHTETLDILGVYESSKFREK